MASLVPMQTYTSKYAYSRMKAIAKLRRTSMSKLIATAIDHELELNAPFEFDLSLPLPDENLDFAYADEAGRILDYVRKLYKGMDLHNLTLARYDMGIPNKEIFLAAFGECLKNDSLEVFKPEVIKGRPPVPEDYKCYRSKGVEKNSAKAQRMRAKDFDKYIRLKKKFENYKEL